MKDKMILIIGMLVAITVAVIMVVNVGGNKKDKDNMTDGADIPIKEGASGFSCSCGCSDVYEMENCECKMCAEEKKEDTGNSAGLKEDVYFYTGEESALEENIKPDPSGVMHVSDYNVEPMTASKEAELVSKIAESEMFSIRRCESEIIDNGVDDPVFYAISESQYIFDSLQKKVFNVAGEDITKKLKFEVSGCEDSFDFLERYFLYRGVSSDFMTDDISHTKDLLLNQRVYSYGIDDCKEFIEIEKFLEGVTINHRDCSYQIKKFGDGVDRILYVTVTVSGTNTDGANVIHYVTYILDYNAHLSKEAVS